MMNQNAGLGKASLLKGAHSGVERALSWPWEPS